MAHNEPLRSNLTKILHLLLISISKEHRSLSRSFCLVIECHWSQRLFGIFAHAAHCGQGTSRSMGYVEPKASHTSRLPYLSASGLATDNYPKLQPEIPQLTLRQIPENTENGCAAQLKQLAKRNIVQVIEQYTFNGPRAHWEKFYSDSGLASAQMHPPPSGILSQIRMVCGNENILKSFVTNCQRSMLVYASLYLSFRSCYAFDLDSFRKTLTKHTFSTAAFSSFWNFRGSSPGRIPRGTWDLHQAFQ